MASEMVNAVVEAERRAAENEAAADSKAAEIVAAAEAKAEMTVSAARAKNSERAKAEEEFLHKAAEDTLRDAKIRADKELGEITAAMMAKLDDAKIAVIDAVIPRNN